MPKRSMEEIMDDLGPLLDEFDQIARASHTRYRSYKSEDLIELDSRAQAACTYSHMASAADRAFLGKDGVRPIELRGLKLWLFEKPNVVIRLKKMDEDGRTRNYPTKQAKHFDAGFDLPNLPMPPVRLTAGYWLDETGTVFERTQVARPMGRRTMWCGAIVPAEERKPGDRSWVDVTRQHRL
jgi:hypothetical protein